MKYFYLHFCEEILWVFFFLTVNLETKKNGWRRVCSYPWIKNGKDELIPNANHKPDSGHMSACDAACLCLILHQEMSWQKAIACSCLCILMSTPWEKYANSFCHQEENRGQESSRYRRGLREEGTCKKGGIGWKEVYMCASVHVCKCVVLKCACWEGTGRGGGEGC